MADHRAEQILDALTTLIDAGTTAKVVRGRTTPLADADLSAMLVYMGGDAPLSELGPLNLGFIDSDLQVFVDLVAKDSVAQIDQTLNQLRKELHIAMMADVTQGLGFVMTTIPQGSDEPDLSQDGETVAASMRTSWAIRYRTSITDPSA